MPISIDTIIDRQLRRWELERDLDRRPQPPDAPPPPPQPLITLSRQHGTHGAEIAGALARRFGYTLLHRDTIDRMCESSGYSHRLLESLDERARSVVANWFDSMLAGRYVDAGDYVRALLRTIVLIAQHGGVVVVGRGANFVLGLEHGFHVRVVAPRERRIANLMARNRMSERAATRDLDATDHRRGEFIRKLYGHSVDDALHYDVVANEADAPPEKLAPWLEAAARAKFARVCAATADEPRGWHLAS
jgi:hypothetical protein